MRVAIGGFQIGSCTFSPLISREADFHILRGIDLLHGLQASGPWDGVLLHLHGAAHVVGMDNANVYASAAQAEDSSSWLNLSCQHPSWATGACSRVASVVYSW